MPDQSGSKIQDRQLPQPPTLSDPLYSFLRQLIVALSSFIRDVTILVNSGKQTVTQLDVLSNEPESPVNGVIVYADGVGWDPGGGEGFYGYEAGAWVKL